ncbi:hypothetical protein LEP1GSC202_3220 [Leptospira yanagawae serovar Saopaulo str. Sao Paulo = ATCC 700523]|uniref:Uncharacterized protein n=1 Tax=Leptospira yanagawae serovar Saopaulo str. Sao Paulo = ATCC 700523 TaxID=1249483 RepID=A0A5E8HAQ5_9LEPT|nr:hypothetical protein LEP1GSC202_3220 [Leptospira yanagawae serovar Saopaulo str. Sao Paulo = ATCC 700523]
MNLGRKGEKKNCEFLYEGLGSLVIGSLRAEIIPTKQSLEKDLSTRTVYRVV